MIYGAEEVITDEISLQSHRTSHFDETSKQEAIRLNLDLLDEIKEIVEIRNANQAQQVAQYYNARVKKKQFHFKI